MADWWGNETREALRRIGMNVRVLRIERGRSQESIALATGMARSHISQLERGAVAPSIHTLLSLSYAMEVSPAEFLRDVSRPLESVPVRRPIRHGDEPPTYGPLLEFVLTEIGYLSSISYDSRWEVFPRAPRGVAWCCTHAPRSW